MELRYWLVPGNVENNRINYLNVKRSFNLVPRTFTLAWGWERGCKGKGPGNEVGVR